MSASPKGLSSTVIKQILNTSPFLTATPLTRHYLCVWPLGASRRRSDSRKITTAVTCQAGRAAYYPTDHERAHTHIHLFTRQQRVNGLLWDGMMQEEVNYYNYWAIDFHWCVKGECYSVNVNSTWQIVLPREREKERESPWFPPLSLHSLVY